MNLRFRDYFLREFFADRPDDAERFFASLEKVVPRSLRVNTRAMSVDDFVRTWDTTDGTLVPTDNPHVFTVEEYANRPYPLGHTWQHLAGYTFIQEVSASMSVHVLSDGHTDTHPLTILDMAASPGAKTTQLAEAYPNALIVAGEYDRGRTPQLVTNIERMACDNIIAVSAHGRVFASIPEAFDRVLLDAPCSGEGICFKAREMFEYWNIKNVKNIARLQTGLLDAAVRTLRTGGEMIYSTCTLNRIENEGVVESILAKYPQSLEVVSMRRYWPHETIGGGFFVTKIRKIAPIADLLRDRDLTARTPMEGLDGRTHRIVADTLASIGLPDRYEYTRVNDRILGIIRHPDSDQWIGRLPIVRWGKVLGTIDHGRFTVDHHVGRFAALAGALRIDLTTPEEIDHYLSGGDISLDTTSEYPYAQMYIRGYPVGFDAVDGDHVINGFPRSWRRGGSESSVSCRARKSP